MDYIEKQFESYLQEELKIKRNLVEYHDSRIHACVYFISPTGRTYGIFSVLTPLNKEFYVLG